MGEAVEVIFEIGEELLLAGAGFEVAEGEFRGVVEGLFGGVAEGGMLGGDTGVVEEFHGFEDRFLGGFKDGVETAEDAHGEDDVGVFAASEEVAEDVVGDAPDEGDDFVVGGLVHFLVVERGARARGDARRRVWEYVRTLTYGHGGGGGGTKNIVTRAYGLGWKDIG